MQNADANPAARENKQFFVEGGGAIIRQIRVDIEKMFFFRIIKFGRS